jgi:hopanoid biosynthesis associated protein HpnK
MKKLIITADDFGLSIPVNEAVESAHQDGILTAASLMVTAPAAADAVERARRLPQLGVGLHLTLLDGRPALPPDQIPDLVGPDGRFRITPAATGIKLFFQAHMQRQVEAEMRAQFELFKRTGLQLDHVDGHHHFHQHPTVVSIVLHLASEYGVRAMRVPQEPFLSSWNAQRTDAMKRLWGWLLSVPRFTGMRARLRQAGIRYNDHMFGLHDSGRMTPERVGRFLATLPEGVSELYCHPATRRWDAVDNLPAAYLCVDEYHALHDPIRRAELERLGVERTTFSRLAID